jgi:hypothetical protein
MLNLIPLPYKVAVAAVAVIAAGAWGFVLGVAWNADDLADCNAVIDRVKEESYALEKQNERIRKDNDRVNRETSDAWAAAVDWHRSNPRIVRVRQDCGGAGGMPGLSHAPQSTDGLRPGSAEGGLSISFSQCEQIANDSLLDYEWIVLMKKFVTEQAKAGK